MERKWETQDDKRYKRNIKRRQLWHKESNKEHMKKEGKYKKGAKEQDKIQENSKLDRVAPLVVDPSRWKFITRKIRQIH